MPDRLSNEQEILSLLHHVNRCLITTELGELSFVQVEALRLVKKHHTVDMGLFAKELAITPASASTLAERLVKGGYLVRVTDELDRRVVRLTLSDESMKRFSEIMTHKKNKMKDALDHMSAKEQDTLKELLTSLNNHINPIG